MLKCSTDVVGTIGLVQELYNFFAGHKRHAVLVDLQKDEHHRKTLKRVSDTTRSWRSTEDRVNTLLDCFQAATTALGELCAESSDSATVNTALSELSSALQNGHDLFFTQCFSTGIVANHGLQMHQYADDCQVCVTTTMSR